MSEPFDLFPGFKTPPNAGALPVYRPAVIITPPPHEEEQHDAWDDEEGPPCAKCDGWGYTDCFCGGDLCVCSYNGERPCWACC
jgi:hypothetical protein